MQLSTAIVDFNLFYDESVDMQIRALLTKSLLGFLDTQVTVMACVPVVQFFECLHPKVK